MERAPERPEASPGYDTSRPLRSFFEVAWGVMLRPTDFFTRLRASEEGTDFSVSGPTWRQILFVMICFCILAALSLLVTLLDLLLGVSAGGLPPGTTDFLYSDSGLVLIASLTLLSIALIPISAMLYLYVGTFLQQVFVWIFIQRDNRSYWATFPVLAYGSVIVLVTWIPVIGFVLALYSVYITMCGLRALHGTSTTRALLAAVSLPLIWFLPALVTYLRNL